MPAKKKLLFFIFFLVRMKRVVIFAPANDLSKLFDWGFCVSGDCLNEGEAQRVCIFILASRDITKESSLNY